jgi:hypothetical protein
VGGEHMGTNTVYSIANAKEVGGQAGNPEKNN